MSDMCALVEIPSISEEDRCKAEQAGRQWAQETQNKLKTGVDIWNKLVGSVGEEADVTLIQGNAELVGMAIEALEEGALRDCILMHTCEGTLAHLGQDVSADYIEETFLKLEQTTPDMKDVAVMLRLLGLCCAYASGNQGYPFALVAYLLWWTGKFRSAYDCIKEALERDSSNSLASLLSRVLGVGVLPPRLARKCGGFHMRALE